MLYIIIAILIFGVLIATHELGHFAAAKLLGVKVNEFAVGMGPAVFKRQRGETIYSLRILPIGGYCAMEGEDDDSADPRAFGRAAGWKKLVILVAGAAMNFLTGLLVMLVLFSQAAGFRYEVYAGSIEGYGTEDCGLLPGDRLLSVDGHRVLAYGNGRFYLDRAGETLDFVVEREGRKVELKDIHLPYQERVDENGTYTRLRGIRMGGMVEAAGWTDKVAYAWNTSLDFVRMVWVSLGDLVTGAVGLRDMAGPVGIVDLMSDVGSQAPTAAVAAWNLGYLAAFIAVNLAVMNLLPLPALDGGRVFFLLLNVLAYRLFRRKIDPKYEGYVHLAGLAALMGLSLVVMMSDIGKLIGR